ncbi:MAG: LuxR family transcriptional regulator [Pseudonocardiaceae bacterium]|nr:MAG: LuxR family transcriptional regulator [Pseudonocardiaceae bacterium]
MADFRERGRCWGGVRAQVALPLRAGPRGGRAFVAQRVDGFTVDEMARLRRVQRLLVGLDRHVTAYAGWSARAPADARDVVDAMAMTPREMSVLDLLSTGLTAAAIGRRLGIAERTVHKHLQRVYLKLGVVDRLAAVQRAGALGLVGGPGPT